MSALIALLLSQVVAPEVKAAPVEPEKLREKLGRGTVVAHGVVRVPCAPNEVFTLVRSLASTAGVAWVQPDWWLAATPK